MSQTLENQKQMWIIEWTNKFGDSVKLTHQYEDEVYKFTEVLINEGKQVRVCQMI